MTKTQIMYRYTLPRSEAARRPAERIQEVTVTTGTKYYTAPDGTRFCLEALTDINGMLCHEQASDGYSPDYVLYDSASGAALRHRRDEALKKLLQINFPKIFSKMCATALEELLEMLEPELS